MNATTLYVEACKCMLSLETDNQAVWDQLFHLLPKLRQALSCRVCRGLLIDPYGSHSCEHYVCKGCLRRKRALTPGCRWCTNLEKLSEDKQARIVLACYQKLCEYIAEIATGAQKLTTQNGEYNKTLAIIQEAVTSPISLAHFQSRQPQVPVNYSESNSKMSTLGGNLNMAAESRVTLTKQLPPEIKLMPPKKVAKLLASPTGNENQKEKKKKKKPFKGSYYNYGKKKKTAVRLTTSSATNLSCNSEPANSVLTNMESLDFKSGDVPEDISNEDEEDNEEIQVVDNVEPELKQDLQQKEVVTHVVTPPGKHKKNKGKLKRCSCGTSSKLQSTRCISTRCPCFSDGGSCEHCPCLNCGNPFSNNNDKWSPDGSCKLKFVDEKNVLTSVE